MGSFRIVCNVIAMTIRVFSCIETSTVYVFRKWIFSKDLATVKSVIGYILNYIKEEQIVFCIQVDMCCRVISHLTLLIVLFLS